MPDLYAAADALADMRYIVEGKADPEPIQQQRRWERRSLDIFRTIYAAQRDRIIDGISAAERDDIRRIIRELYQGEPEIVQRETRRLFDELALEMSEQAQQSIGGAGINADAVTAALLQTSTDLADRYGREMATNSERLSLAVVEDWLREDGATIGDLQERMVRVWPGSRPAAAARTEITRLNTRARAATWEASGIVWGYDVVTRNDSLVRPSHTQVAQGGPYPLSDTQHLPPVNGDINCRCSTVPVLLVEAQRRGLA